MAADPADTIDTILDALPAPQQAALQDLRRTIAAAAPGATERISYGTPAFEHRARPLVGYGAARNHCSLYVMSPAVLERHLAELADFVTSKGTIRFTPDRPIPADLVATIVGERVAEIDSGH